MVRPDVAARKIARASAWLDDSEVLLSRRVDEFVAAAKDRDLAAFYLLLAIQECIDLAAHGSPMRAGPHPTTPRQRSMSSRNDKPSIAISRLPCASQPAFATGLLMVTRCRITVVSTGNRERESRRCGSS